MAWHEISAWSNLALGKKKLVAHLCTCLAHLLPFLLSRLASGMLADATAYPRNPSLPASLPPPSLGFARGWMSDGEIFASLRSVRITVSLNIWQFDEHLIANVFLGKVSQALLMISFSISVPLQTS